jgi:hypothetical protein
MRICFHVLAAFVLPLCGFAFAFGADEAITPKGAPIVLFDGHSYDALYSWLADTKYDDPRKVFAVEDGVIHISGDGFGYLATKARYKDYHLVVEYRWGDKTWRHKKDNARDSGIIVHCVEPDGTCAGVFMAGIEAQIIEGGTGDFWIVPGTYPDGKATYASLVVETGKDRKDQVIWKKGGERVQYVSKPMQRINWFDKDPDWADVTGFRGQRDVQGDGHEWTRLEVVCDGGRIQNYVNGVLVNEGFDAVPSSGKILLQTEGAELFVRRFELLPLGQKP